MNANLLSHFSRVYFLMKKIVLAGSSEQIFLETNQASISFFIHRYFSSVLNTLCIHTHAYDQNEAYHRYLKLAFRHNILDSF